MRIRSLSAAALSLALVSRTTVAQEPPLTQPAAIPLELAMALTGSGGLGAEADPVVLVGSIPAWVTQRVAIPSGWRTLGSAFLGTTVIAVVQVPTSNDTLIKEFEQHLHRNGWKAPPPQPSQMYASGFRPPPPAATIERASRRFTACRENQVLSSWISRQQALATTIVFRLGQSAANSTCNPREPDPRMLQAMRERGEPTLIDPSPWDFGRSGCQQEDGGWSGSETQYRSPMTADQILDHYARQLADSGWLATPSRQAPVARTWTRTDAGGVPRRMTLTVTRGIADSSCVRVHMQNRNPPRPP